MMLDNNAKKYYKIRIKEGTEHHSNVMDIYDEDAFFFSSFQQSARAVTAIVERSKHFESNQGKGLLSTNISSLSIAEYHNNIIAFCADRGQGKTSAMLSIVEALRKIKEPSAQIRRFWNSEEIVPITSGLDNPVLHTYFEHLDVVDPACMEHSDSLIRTIISKMFKSASDRWKRIAINSTSGESANQYKLLKEELAGRFLTCFKGLDFLYKDKNTINTSYDDLNMLAEYGDSSNFKYSFYLLIQSYLEFMSFGCKNDHSMLVIPIDDADLDSVSAHAVMEQIRKYCILPNVLILMALHIGTLSRTIEQYFLSQYNTLIDNTKDPTIRERCHRAMERYIDKLLPTSHRVHLKSIDNFLRDEYDRIILSYVDTQNKDKLVNDIVSNSSINTYQEQLIALIYQKTGIILWKPDSYLHEFLPESMRELNHFLYYFSSMQNVIRLDEGKKVCGTFDYLLGLLKEIAGDKHQEKANVVLNEIDFQLNNIALLENYFYHSWCPLRLGSLQIKIIDKMYHSSRWMMNLRTINQLKWYLRNAHEDDWNYLIHEKLIEEYHKDNLPFSDIIFYLYNLEKLDDSQDMIGLIYAIRLYYSIYFRKITLNGIKAWINRGRTNMLESSPFSDLLTLTGYSLFPIAFYQKKHLHGIIFQCYSDKGYIEDEKLYSVFKHFMCEVDESRDKVLPIFSRSALRGQKGKYYLEKDKQYFDLFRPIISVLGIDDLYVKFFDKDSNTPVSLLCTALRIICNVDLQLLLYRRYFNSPLKEGFTAESIVGETVPGQKPLDSIRGIYQKVDSVIEKHSIIKANISVTSFLGNDSGKICLFGADNFVVLDQETTQDLWKNIELFNVEKPIDKYSIDDIVVKQDLPVDLDPETVNELVLSNQD